MAESKYKIIEKDEQDINTDLEEEEEEYDDEDDDYRENFDDDTVTIITSSNNESHSAYPNPNKFNEVNIMQTPAAILALILVYFAFSIGLTFYQRSLLKVN